MWGLDVHPPSIMPLPLMVLLLGGCMSCTHELYSLQRCKPLSSHHPNLQAFLQHTATSHFLSVLFFDNDAC